MDWFLYDNGRRHERVKHIQIDDPVQFCPEEADKIFWLRKRLHKLLYKKRSQNLKEAFMNDAPSANPQLF